MGCLGAKQTRPARREAEPELLKILLLGVAGCGKSTTAKQFKITHPTDSGSEAVFIEDELENYRKIILRNLYYGLSAITQSLEPSKEYKKALKFFKDWNVENPDADKESAPEARDYARLLSTHPDVRSTIQNQTDEFPVYLVYYLENVERITSSDYVPTNQDIVWCRQRSIGLTRTRFKKDRYLCELIDPGGQPIERRKWIKALEEDITAVLFIVAANEFNVKSEYFDDKTTFEESLEEWSQFVNSDSSKNRCVILFLNKVDVLKSKIPQLKTTFKDYKGNNYETAIEFLKQKFLNELEDERQKVFVHPTCAVDTNQIQVIFKSVFASIFESRLKRLGM